MAAQLDDVVEALGDIQRVLQSIIDLMRESGGAGRPSSAKVTTIESAFGSGGNNAAGSSAQQDFSKSSGSTSVSSKAGPNPSAFAQSNIAAARQVGLGFVQSAADPLTPTASAGLSAGEQLLTIVAGAVGGPKAADAAQALAGAAFNAAGGRQAKFVLDNTVSDLQSTIESLSAQGLSLKNDQIDSLVAGYKERNTQRFSNLAAGAAGIDRVFGGALTAQQDKKDEYAKRTAEAVEELARNRRNDGNGSTRAGD